MEDHGIRTGYCARLGWFAHVAGVVGAAGHARPAARGERQGRSRSHWVSLADHGARKVGAPLIRP